MLLPVAILAILLGTARLSLDEWWAAAAAMGVAVMGPAIVLLGLRSPTLRSRRRALLVGLALVSPVLLAGPSAWMTVALTVPCNPCPPHFCADTPPPASGSSPFVHALAAFAFSLVAVCVAPWVGRKLAARADALLSVLAPSAFVAALATLGLGSVVAASAPTPADYLERLPIVGLATEQAPLGPSDSSAVAVSVSPYHGRKLSARMSAGSASGSCGLYDPDARAVTVRADGPRRELVLSVAPGERFRCSADTLECTPLTADELGSAVRPSAAWTLGAAVGLFGAGIALALRARWSRQLRAVTASTVYRGEPNVGEETHSRIRERMCVADACVVLASAVVVSSPLWRLILLG